MRFAGLMAAVLVATTAAAARAEMTSGPQVGERVGAFTVTKVTGNVDDGIKDGQHLCYRCKTGARPAVMIFARSADDTLARLVKEIEAEVEEHADDKLIGFVNMIGSDAASLSKAAGEFVSKHGIKRVAFVVPDDAANGPPDFKIAPDADVTVVCYREGKVKSNHAFAKGGLTDASIDAVEKAVCKLVED